LKETVVKRAEIPQSSITEKEQNYIKLAIVTGKIYEENTTSICATCAEKIISQTSMLRNKVAANLFL